MRMPAQGFVPGAGLAAGRDDQRGFADRTPQIDHVWAARNADMDSHPARAAIHVVRLKDFYSHLGGLAFCFPPLL